LVSSVCGGAIIPVILGNVADKIGTRHAMCIPLIFFAFAWSYPIYLNFTHKAAELDAYSESHVGVQPGAIDNDSILASKDVEASHREKY
jgi:FHS family L-fucose permease-like MFS transporter